MKQIILIRADLNMGIGKIAVQASHASMSFLLQAQTDDDLLNVDDWLNGGQTKICLQIHSEEELLELHEKALSANLDTHFITDAGRTEFGGVPTKTCLAIGPNKCKDIDKITKHLKLY